jgi:glycosyltransferase involved in cell wall biosynthesis
MMERFYSKERKMENGISVIIPVWNSDKYIEECLDSVAGQRFFAIDNNYEILVGIDGCEKSLQAVLAIADKYKNLRVLNFKKNYGAYVVRNTLAYQAKYDYLLFFDADDIMLPFMVAIHVFLSKMIDVAYHGYRRFENGKLLEGKTEIAQGTFGIRTEVFRSFGGFMDWKCGADSEFCFRVKNTGIETEIIPSVCMHRRVHPESLTKRKETTFGSPARQYAIEHCESTKERRIEPVFGEFDIAYEMDAGK